MCSNDEEHVMHSKSDNIEFMINDNADKVTEKHFESLPNDVKPYWNIIEK